MGVVFESLLLQIKFNCCSLLDYFLGQKDWVCRVGFLNSSQGLGEVFRVGRSYLFCLCIPQALILLLDFVAHTNQLSGTLCTANIILIVHQIFIFSMTSPWLPHCLCLHLASRGQRSAPCQCLSIVCMFLPLAFCWTLHWLSKPDWVAEEGMKSAPLLRSHCLQAAGKFISDASWYPR